MTDTALTEAIHAAATGDPRRYVITGGPSSGKDDLIATIHTAGIPCMQAEPGREIYRKHRERLGRHLLRELIVQGYYDGGYERVFVSPDSAANRLDFICANLRLPKPNRGV